jgi:hypothetical protein
MRLIVYWRDNDCIIGQHVRDTEVEVKAAVEAAQLIKAKKEPEKAPMPVPKAGHLADHRPLYEAEVAHYLKWRIRQNWEAMKKAVPAAKAKRRSAKKARVSP